MNILFIPQWYPTSLTPNSGAFNLEIAQAIVKIANVDVLTVQFKDGLRFNEMEMIMGKSSFSEYEYYVGNSKIRLFNTLFMRGIYKSVLLDYFKSNKLPDIIHSQDIISYYVLKSIKDIGLKIPVVVSQHWSVFLRKKMNFLVKKRYQYIFENASFILPANKNADKEYARFNLKGNIKWLPNCINIDIFKLDKSIEREKIILHVSGFTKVKRVEDVINSFKEILKYDPEFKLIFIGDGVDKSFFEIMAHNELPSNSFEFLGYLGKKEIAHYLQRASCFLFPSSFETFGVVLIEAAATGCPIITTKTGGIPFVLQKNQAHFVQVGNIDEIKNALLNIIQNKSMVNYDQLSDSIREKFSQEKLSFILNETYVKLMTKEVMIENSST